jgi:hypothetical protein
MTAGASTPPNHKRALLLDNLGSLVDAAISRAAARGDFRTAARLLVAKARIVRRRIGR